MICATEIAGFAASLPSVPGDVISSPSRIVAYIREEHSDLAPLWRSLHVSDGSFACDAHCTATLLDGPTLRSVAQRFVVVRLQSSQFDPPYRFLVYSRPPQDQRWAFRGAVDFRSDECQCGPPEPRLENIAGSDWLTFHYGRVCRGTGVGVSEERWYDTGSQRVDRPFTFSDRGEDFAGTTREPGWRWKAEATRYERAGARETLYVDATFWFYATSPASDRDVAFSIKRCLIAFTRAAGGDFRLDVQRSTPDAAAFWELSRNVVPNDRTATFTRFNLVALRHIATTGTPERRRWLRDVVEHWRNSEYKAELTTLLTQPAKQ